MLELRGVTKSYGEAVVLAPLDLVCARDETTVLIGPSGCGKSTLLKLINGLLVPDAGEVRFDGTRLTPQNAQGLRRRMGYVIQEGGLFPHLTARDNVELLARHIGIASAQRAARIAELCELAHFEVDLLGRYPRELSGGQRQRVALMRALMLDPEVLLLDEPLGALDPMIRAGLQEDLRSVFRACAKTVVLVTHDVGEAAFFADRVVLLRDGRVVQEGAPRELVERPAEPFVEAFVRAQRTGWEAMS
ncbi:MAG: ATP-binding cassette domain-containing protein [bacterium]|nr:ATP-binding cassette domain-containing protein [bacterium]